jgi:hypothetical protein
MSDARRAAGAGRAGPRPFAALGGFRRARRLLWLASGASVACGAALHDWALRSTLVRLLWLVTSAAALAGPLRFLLGFRCPRCGSVYLASGGWRDFLGVGRLLWGRRCQSCTLHLTESPPPSSAAFPELPRI